MSDRIEMKLFYQKMKSPIGVLNLVGDKKNLVAIIFEMNWSDFQKKHKNLEKKSVQVLVDTQTQLQEYFSKKRRTFDLPLNLEGTEFQKQVWRSLTKIGFGKTKTYQEQASLIKNPNAVRAVGRTNGLNPICIIVPCHRVIGKSGKLTGYAGGLPAKKFLLELEGITVLPE